MGADVSSAQPMAASSGSPLNSNGGVLVNAGRPTSMEQSLGGTTGFVAGVMAGRRLQQATVSWLILYLNVITDCFVGWVKCQATIKQCIHAPTAAAGCMTVPLPPGTTGLVLR